MTSILPISVPIVGVLLLTPLASLAACWEEAESTYGVSAKLLYAVAGVESNLNPAAMNMSHKDRTGSYDIGLMQINSGHLTRLAKYGITEAKLKDPCTNIKVGAWLLSDLFTRFGATWDTVGAYNAACTQLKGDACVKARSTYAWKVYTRLVRAEPLKTAKPRQPPPTSGAMLSLASLTTTPSAAPASEASGQAVASRASR